MWEGFSAGAGRRGGCGLPASGQAFLPKAFLPKNLSDCPTIPYLQEVTTDHQAVFQRAPGRSFS
jgi:hypothetical protein